MARLRTVAKSAPRPLATAPPRTRRAPPSTPAVTSDRGSLILASEDAGGILNPVGWTGFGEGSYLVGISCPCGRALLVASRLADGGEPLACPHCGEDLRR